jgi:glycosyltransferase involved in cell wall biosynthesis
LAQSNCNAGACRKPVGIVLLIDWKVWYLPETGFLKTKGKREMRVVHLTSAHPRGDSRIFGKQSRTLARAGYQVTLVVADGKGDAVIDGVSIRDVGKSASRSSRMLNATRRVYKAAQDLDAAAYHFHDPELLPVGLLLKKAGKIVIFDAHEDVSKQIMAKHYIPKPARATVSVLYAALESRVSRHLDAVVCATPSIARTFNTYSAKAEVVRNYPIVGELAAPSANVRKAGNVFCHVGVLSEIRGIRELVLASGRAKNEVKLRVGGYFSSVAFENEIMSLPEAQHVDWMGWLDRYQVANLFAESICGVVTPHPAPNHVEGLPIKMFEYMSAGLPVIATNFPHFQKMITEADCGICVDPTEVQTIADAMDELITNRDRAQRMGLNGQRAVQQTYNWDNEAKTLLALYETLVGPPA